jgi:hypothetical protein
MTDKTDQINKTDTTDKADPTNTATDDIHALLADLWQRHLPTLHDRLNILDRTAKEATSGNLPEPTREEAQSIAHKLAGNLGMFGHSEANPQSPHRANALRTLTPRTITTSATRPQSIDQLVAAERGQV